MQLEYIYKYALAHEIIGNAVEYFIFLSVFIFAPGTDCPKIHHFFKFYKHVLSSNQKIGIIAYFFLKYFTVFVIEVRYEIIYYASFFF